MVVVAGAAASNRAMLAAHPQSHIDRPHMDSQAGTSEALVAALRRRQNEEEAPQCCGFEVSTRRTAPRKGVAGQRRRQHLRACRKYESHALFIVQHAHESVLFDEGGSLMQGGLSPLVVMSSSSCVESRECLVFKPRDLLFPFARGRLPSG